VYILSLKFLKPTVISAFFDDKAWFWIFFYLYTIRCLVMHGISSSQQWTQKLFFICFRYFFIRFQDTFTQNNFSSKIDPPYWALIPFLSYFNHIHIHMEMAIWGWFCYVTFNSHMFNATEVQLWKWCFHLKIFTFDEAKTNVALPNAWRRSVRALS
jgi:hypothetical protein